MNKRNSYPKDSSFESGLYQTLVRRIPPNSLSPYLEELIIELTLALSLGEIDINLSEFNLRNNKHQQDLKENPITDLLKSGWLDGENSLLVLEKDRLSFRRWYEDLNSVCEDLIRRSNLKQSHSQEHNMDFDSIDFLNKQQSNAVNAVKNQKIIVLSGGPGTGKTSTILGMIEKALHINSNFKIGLATPTGKASRRLKNAMQNGLSKKNIIFREKIYEIPCKTIHSWLESRNGQFKRNHQNLLPIDLLVIDEMSMVDLSLMKSILLALPSKSQLILVGDPYQLPPIGIGNIWNHLHQESTLSKFGLGSIKLDKVYRNRGGIIKVSNLLKNKGLNTFWNEIEKLPKSSNIKYHCSNSNNIPPNLIKKLEKHFQTIKAKSNLLSVKLNNHEFSLENNTADILASEELLDLIDDTLVLTPNKKGAWGVNHIHTTLLGNFLPYQNNPDLENGTPIMCTQNQDELNLANGDIGVVIGSKGNQRYLFRTYGEDEQWATKLIHPARIKQIEPALAMTIHKSQGSEAKKVFLLWPEQPNSFTGKEPLSEENRSYEIKLLYTAITRAKEEVHFYAKDRMI